MSTPISAEEAQVVKSYISDFHGGSGQVELRADTVKNYLETELPQTSPVLNALRDRIDDLPNAKFNNYEELRSFFSEEFDINDIPEHLGEHNDPMEDLITEQILQQSMDSVGLGEQPSDQFDPEDSSSEAPDGTHAFNEDESISASSDHESITTPTDGQSTNNTEEAESPDAPEDSEPRRMAFDMNELERNSLSSFQDTQASSSQESSAETRPDGNGQPQPGQPPQGRPRAGGINLGLDRIVGAPFALIGKGGKLAYNQYQKKKGTKLATQLAEAKIIDLKNRKETIVSNISSLASSLNKSGSPASDEDKKNLKELIGSDLTAYARSLGDGSELVGNPLVKNETRNLLENEIKASNGVLEELDKNSENEDIADLQKATGKIAEVIGKILSALFGRKRGNSASEPSL